MQKILIITGNYYPKPSANGICSHQIALALIALGYDVHILCYKKKYDNYYDKSEGISIYRSEMSFFSRMKDFGERINQQGCNLGRFVYYFSVFVNRVKLFLYLPLYPMNSIHQSLNMYRKAVDLQKINNYTGVISVFNPLDSLIAGALLKRKYPNIKFVLYFLDSITQSWGHKFITKRQLDCMGWKWEKRIFSIADFVIAMKYHKVEHLSNRYNNYRNKIKYLDIPLFRELKITFNDRENPFNKSFLNVTYTGRLEMDQYEPWYAIEIFENISEDIMIQLHFYSRGSCEEKLSEMMRKSELVISHGYVKTQEAIKAMIFSDVLISIGTFESNMIPSKIFEYMSTGKPIIHFYKQENDVCLPYFEKYPLSLAVYEKNQFNENLCKVRKFIEEATGKNVSNESIMDLFVHNTPAYTAEFIDTLLRKKEEHV